jgi:hypothetical protein
LNGVILNHGEMMGLMSLHPFVLLFEAMQWQTWLVAEMVCNGSALALC